MGAIKKHEQRRVDVYKKAYGAYLKIFESEITGKCPKDGLNKLKAEKYRDRLESWLTDKQSKAKSKFSTWSRTQQNEITGENSSYLDEDGGKWPESGKLFDSIGSPHEVGDPPAMDMSCPN